jgi:hypothetical protein
LPKEFQAAAEGETCYFLDGFKYAGIDEKQVQGHIDAALEKINSEN